MGAGGGPQFGDAGQAGAGAGPTGAPSPRRTWNSRGCSKAWEAGRPGRTPASGGAPYRGGGRHRAEEEGRGAGVMGAGGAGAIYSSIINLIITDGILLSFRESIVQINVAINCI